jgi:integrase
VANIKGKTISLREIAAQPSGPFLMWDCDLKGFNCRRQFSNVITYSVIYRTRDGIQHWHKIGRHGVLTPTEARAEARNVLRAVTLGEDPSALRHALRNGATMAELLDQYVSDMGAHRINGKKSSTIKSDKSRIATHLRPRLGKYRVSAITQSQIEDFMNACPSGSARRIISLLGSIFTFAVRKKLRSDNPCAGIKKPKDIRRLRRLSEIEYALLGEALNGGAPINDTAKSVIKALSITGWRSGEICSLKWSELDIERKIATLMDTKSGQSVRPLSSASIEIFKAQPRNGEYVFSYKDGIITTLNQYFIKLDLPKDITPHVLRHSFASLSADLGFSDNVIAGMLGHSRSSITSRYIHLEKALIEASDAVAAETLRLMRS